MRNYPKSRKNIRIECLDEEIYMGGKKWNFVDLKNFNFLFICFDFFFFFL